MVHIKLLYLRPSAGKSPAAYRVCLGAFDIDKANRVLQDMGGQGLVTPGRTHKDIVPHLHLLWERAGFRGALGIDGSSHLHEPWHCIVEELLIALTEVTFAGQLRI